ncbi:sulfite exporter TauE/SafE family protein [Endothiovibrio diazotrophicus]
MTDLLIYLPVGAVVGVIAGMLGVGGGLLIVPVLVWLFTRQGMAPEVVTHVAVGTSLATIVITSIASIRAHHKRGAVAWPTFGALTPGIVSGAFVGAWLAHRLPSGDLGTLFGVFELSVATQMGLALRPRPHRTLPGPAGLAAAGGVIGTLSAIVGVGGGTLTVPFLSWCNVEMRRAVATSAACGLPIAIAGAAGFVINGWGAAGLPDWSSGYLYWPAFAGIVAASALTAPAGAWLAHTLPTDLLKRLFALFLLGLGLWMILR